MLVINLLVGLAAPSGWASFAAAIIVSLGLAALSWTLIEKPYLTGKRGALRAVSDGSSVSGGIRPPTINAGRSRH
jgi:peptidoglycan/LPS O-acetylase OafA/YrhL